MSPIDIVVAYLLYYGIYVNIQLVLFLTFVYNMDYIVF